MDNVLGDIIRSLLTDGHVLEPCNGDMEVQDTLDSMVEMDILKEDGREMIGHASTLKRYKLTDDMVWFFAPKFLEHFKEWVPV